MRPRGVKNGRTPRGGYPELPADDAGFLAGFIEGEASFSVSPRIGAGTGQYFSCALTLNVRDDDSALLDSLATMTQLGRIRRKPARCYSKPQAVWTITAKADCFRLTEILDAVPLRGRKLTDYAIWRAAVNWWIDGDPRARRPNRDWRPMAYLAERVKKVKVYEATAPVQYPDPPGLKPDWLPYLAGFLTAEGHLGIGSAGGSRVRPVMRVNVRADDAPLLAELARRTGVGRIYGYPVKQYQASPVMNWSVFSATDLRKLVAILDLCPPRGKKLREYKIWREAVLCLRPNYATDQPRLRRIAERLNVERAYVEEADARDYPYRPGR